MAAMDTGETVLGLTIGLVDDTALRASPASVAWVDQGHRDCLPLHLVFGKLAELIEGPSCKTAALRLSN
jgi:hypothetical protein